LAIPINYIIGFEHWHWVTTIQNSGSYSANCEKRLECNEMHPKRNKKRLERNKTCLARNETRGGNLLLSGTVFERTELKPLTPTLLHRVMSKGNTDRIDTSFLAQQGKASHQKTDLQLPSVQRT